MTVLEKTDRLEFYFDALVEIGGGIPPAIKEAFERNLLQGLTGEAPVCPPLDPNRKLLVTDLRKDEVIHCKSEVEAIRICKLIHDAGITWKDGRTFLEYNYYMPDICYNVFYPTYNELSWYTGMGNTIYNSRRF